MERSNSAELHRGIGPRPCRSHRPRFSAGAEQSASITGTAEALAHPPAPGEKSGITAGLFTQVDDLWERYNIAVGAPTGVRSKRKTLTAGLPGKFRAIEEIFSDLDDLIIQFGTTEGICFPLVLLAPWR